MHLLIILLEGLEDWSVEDHQAVQESPVESTLEGAKMVDKLSKFTEILVTSTGLASRFVLSVREQKESVFKFI